MTAQERRIHQAMSKIMSKEKPIKVTNRKGDGTTKDFLNDVIKESLLVTRAELDNQVTNGKFTKAEATEIFEALKLLPEITQPRPGTLVAVYPEYKLGDVYLHSIIISTQETL